MIGRDAHWRALVEAGLMAAPPDRERPAAWYIRALQGFGAWVASIFLVVAVAILVGGNDEFAMGFIGVVSLVSAFLLLRGTRADFLYHASLALSLAGQLCITIAFAKSSDAFVVALVVGVVAAILVVIMDDFAHRLIAALVVSGAVIVAAIDLKAGAYAAPLLAVAFALLWASEPRWLARRTIAEPLALGLGFGLLAVTLVTLRFSVFGVRSNDELAYVVRVVLLLAALGYVLLGALRDSGVTGARRQASLVIAVAAALALELAVGNASAALLVLVAAVRAQRAMLAVAALLTLLALVSHRYYMLQLTLLVKSLWLMGAGVVLLALYLAARRWWGGARRARAARHRPGTAALGAAASVGVCLLFSGVDVLRSEAVLADGRVMVLQLAPVDPRSLLQGDYMRLAFAVERTVTQRLRDAERQQGWVVLQEDENGIAQFVSLSAERPEPSPGTFAIRYRWGSALVSSRMQLTMLTDAFFFQEGTAEVYEAARFGAFRVGEGGEVLLEAMLDETQAPLGAQY